MAITTYSAMIEALTLHDNDVFAVDQPDVMNPITEAPGVSRKTSLRKTSQYMAESEAVIAKINHFVDIEKNRAETEEDRLDAKLDAEISRSTGVDIEFGLALAGEIMRAKDEEFKKVDKAIAENMVESLSVDGGIEDKLVVNEKLTRLDGSGSSIVPIAFPDATEIRAGIMTIEQVKAIAFLLAEVESIHGKTARLNAHDFMTDTPADAVLTAYAMAQLKLSDVSSLPNLIGVRNIYNAHLFVFNQESIQIIEPEEEDGEPEEIVIPAVWTDQGLDTVNTATQESLGVVQGSSDDWKARINEAGEIAVNTTKADGTAPGLSDDTFTTAEKTKLADLPSNSELQEQIGDEVAAVTERLDDHDEAVEALRTDKADKADVYTKAEIDGKIASALHYKGSVPTEGDLPAAGNAIGDVYNILDTGKNAAWDGTAWDNLSGVVSLTDYMTRQETSTAINAEAAAREAGDIALQTNLGLTNSAVSNEITNRQTADQTLQANINAANAALTLEAQARTSSDEALALNIVNLGNALTQEASGRDDADTALREELTDYIDQSLAAAVQATSYAGTLDTESGLPDSGTVHGQYYEIDDMDITAPGSSGRAVWNAVTQPAQWDIRTDRQREADGETIGFRTSDGALKILDVSLAAPAEDNTPPAAKTDTLKNILQWLTNKIAGLFDLVSAKADLTAKSTLAVGSTVYDPFAGASGNKTIALVNDLTTGGSNAVLSAEQGKVLKTALDGLVKLVLPVGTVMGFYTALDPNTQYPGTAWVKLGNDVFLRSVTGTPGGTGGANTDTDVVAHTHTTPATGIASSGAHTHNIKSRQWNNYANGYISSTDGTKAETSVSNGNTDGAHTHTVPAMTTNGQSASVASHNNRPAYIDIVFWKRTA